MQLTFIIIYNILFRIIVNFILLPYRQYQHPTEVLKQGPRLHKKHQVSSGQDQQLLAKHVPDYPSQLASQNYLK